MEYLKYQYQRDQLSHRKLVIYQRDIADSIDINYISLLQAEMPTDTLPLTQRAFHLTRVLSFVTYRINYYSYLLSEVSHQRKYCLHR